jgi:hypothetical protein
LRAWGKLWGTEAESTKEAVMGEAGWHPDPHHRHELRWWDGAAWTDHVSDHGVASVDPVAAVPPAMPTMPSTPIEPTAPVAGFGAALPPPSFQPPASAQPTTPYQPVGQAGPAMGAMGPPTGGQPIVVPVQASGSPEKNKRGLWVAVVLGVLALGVGTAVVLSLGGDDDQSASDRTDETVEDTTDETDETVADTEVDTTAVATTAAPTTVAETVPPTTVPLTLPSTVVPVTAAPTTLPALATVDVLVAALPTAAEVPPGFTASLDGPDTEFDPASGQGIGLCGGDNSDARAQSANLTARAWSAGYQAPTGRLWVGLFAFPTPEDASSFMSITAVQATACGAGFTFQSPESDWDIFSDDVDATWDIVENAGAQPATSPAEESFALSTQYVSTTRLDGVNYSSTDGDVIQYERYGSVVVLFDRSGSWNPVGFGNIDTTTVYQPTPADVAALADTLRQPVLDRLRASGLIA